MQDNIKEALVKILGIDARNNDFQVSDQTRRLVKTVNYLVSQMDIIKRGVDAESQEYILSVLESTEEILTA